ncbi:MAG: complex I subunit 5 family protein [Lachnospiraceae bacterium]|nr:complex I subunit 5 family protein [Lachnospiraceae bacterium]
MIGLVIGIPFAGAFAGLLAVRYGGRRVTEEAAAAAVSVITLIFVCLLPFGGKTFHIGTVMGSGLTFAADGFRCVYALVTAVMWTAAALFSPEYFAHEREHIGRYMFFFLLTLGATEGVMLSGDLMTAFVFFEILSFTSFTWVIHEQTPEAIRAGYTYLFIAVIGGLVLLMGLLLLKHSAGTLSFAELRDAVDSSGNKGEILAAGICILLGFGAKAGMFPVHVWLPKAHPVAPSPASALLSGVLTKVGIYGILMTSLTALAGNRSFGLIVLCTGVITMVLGAVLALFSVNLKRTLACSSMSQIGFILTGTAMNLIMTAYGSHEATVTALPGLMLHMVNHSMIKLTLFMAAGVVVMNVHSLDLNVIQGYGRNKPFFKAAFAFGALGISGVPLFNGYISKTLLHEGIVEGIHECADLAGILSVIEWVFLFSGGITFAYMLKLFICVFVRKNADPLRQARYDADAACMNRLSTAVVFGSSLVMPILGQPAVILRLAAVMTGEEEILHFRAFTLTNLKGGLISLSIGAFLYLVVVRKVLTRDGIYLNLWPEKLDLENMLYRPLLTVWLPGIFGTAISVFGENKLLIPLSRAAMFVSTFVCRVFDTGTDALVVFLHGTVFRERKGRKLPEKGLKARLFTLQEEVIIGGRPLTENLSFALLMTNIGILLVLGTLAYLLLLR